MRPSLSGSLAVTRPSESRRELSVRCHRRDGTVVGNVQTERQSAVAATADEELVIQITDPNEQILRYVVARIKTLAGYKNAQADEGGRIALPRQRIEEIGLIHELWPDRLSCFAVSNPALNQFVFHEMDGKELSNWLFRGDRKRPARTKPLRPGKCRSWCNMTTSPGANPWKYH